MTAPTARASRRPWAEVGRAPALLLVAAFLAFLERPPSSRFSSGVIAVAAAKTETPIASSWAAAARRLALAASPALLARGGDGYGDPSQGTKDRGEEIGDLIESLAHVVRGDDGGGCSEDEEAKMWRRLGRHLLDAGERAESARVFRYGAGRCPGDDGLGHHRRVYEAFHGSAKAADECAASSTASAAAAAPQPPPTPPDGRDLLRSDPPDGSSSSLLVSFDVPPEAVPPSALNACRRPSAAADTGPQQQRERDDDLLRRSLAPRIVHATTRPVLPPDACSYLIDAAVRAAERRGGYTTDRHVHAPTCDIPSFDFDGAASEYARDVLRGTLFPLLEGAFPDEMEVEADELRVQDCFVVRYDGGEQADGGGEGEGRRGPGFASLRPHEDESLLSLTVALNDMSEYDGGGLFVASTGDLLNGDAGTLMCFAGGLVHGGYPVAMGTRWILTAFLYVDRNDSRREKGYVLREILGEKEEGGQEEG